MVILNDENMENVDRNENLPVSIEAEIPRLSKAEENCHGLKPIEIIGETWCCETIYFLVKLEDGTSALLLPCDVVKNKYPELYENYRKE
ncbi:hypothetical protein Mgra_00000369 [Meloidogyne graminicola]|uniref:Uncharacterized protein n=1 Tax=Meloidogyne graminicola TaxID=189291 RepID=A0A8T0A309_9BILA|nr:hypothetical protein Mgra_00000369 [Meloidogyne graminicola]